MNSPPPSSALLPQEESGVEQELYAVRQKIFPRAVSGVFARWRVAMVLVTQLVFYATPWLTWNGRQAVLFDLVERKFYVFGLILWPQDFIYLTALLVISALSLFLFTAVAGRLWCGYACPQTVYTEIFLWIERKIEGDRVKQIKLDKMPWGTRKLTIKGIKHAAWIALALWTGFTFVGYFTPIKTLAAEVVGLSLGPWETWWILFYGFATYGNAGWMREQVCLYMCPYARFQSVMFDPDTLIVSYDKARGEPRGARSKSADYKTLGLGHCIDCNICVQVCPTGIDIRKGLQYECIGCAACIDGCNQVMEKMRYPKGLIRMTTENALAGRYREPSFLSHVIRPRTLIYGAVLLALVGAFSAALYLREPLRLNVMRDRAALGRETANGQIENVYRLQIMNMTEAPRRFKIDISGIAGAKVEQRSESEGHGEAAAVEVPALAARLVPVDVYADPENVASRNQSIEFHVTAQDDPSLAAVTRSTFLKP
jgi:cytochrome c oxidase accessory protein FixG